MNYWLPSLFLLIFSTFTFAVEGESEPAAAEQAETPPLSSSATGSLLPESGRSPKESVMIKMLSDDAFKPEVQRLPQLMEKLRIENFAADNPYVLLPHRPNYILPIAWYSHPGEHTIQGTSTDPTDVTQTESYDHLEAIFQFSIKYPIAKDVLGKMSRLDMAYTNRSFWQVYNTEISRPFRETNHEPELILSWQTQNKYIDYFALALNHQSNGQSSMLSRSWNRVIFETGAVFSSGILHSKVWWRIPEPTKSNPLSAHGDDNPDITHYMGRGELQYIFHSGGNTVSVLLRNNLKSSSNKGAIEIGYNFPIHKRIQGYFQYFNGYGDSMIDYDRNQQRIAVGIKLSDWL